MSDFERLLVPGCTELPACRCGTEMDVARTYASAGKIDTHIRVYNCPACRHEMRFTVWGADPRLETVYQLAASPVAHDKAGNCAHPAPTKFST
jgi:hypothetical protein